MSTKSDITISLSQANCFRDCQQKYSYQYVEGLQRRETAPPMELGSVIHAYLEQYYTSLQSGEEPQAAHQLGLGWITQEWKPKLNDLAELAYAMGSEEVALELRELFSKALYLCERYWVVRGEDDAKRHTILLIEKELRVRLGKGLQAVGYADLVTQDKETGLTYMWEHKSHQAIPSLGFRLRDAQTVLYAEMLKAMGGPAVSGVMWNYVRTAAPAIPERLKNGQFTRRALDTTWHMYLQTIVKGGEDPAAYSDMQERLARKELNDFFPREEYLMMGDPSIILRDFVQTGQDIVKARKDWAKGVREPVRSLSRSCDWCSFNKLCTAAIALGGEDAVKGAYFSTKEQRRNRELVSAGGVDGL